MVQVACVADVVAAAAMLVLARMLVGAAAGEQTHSSLAHQVGLGNRQAAMCDTSKRQQTAVSTEACLVQMLIGLVIHSILHSTLHLDSNSFASH